MVRRGPVVLASEAVLILAHSYGVVVHVEPLEDAVESEECLEEYLRSAPIDYVLDLPGGGGHSAKKTLILRGGVGVAAKPAHDPDSTTQAANEVAASIVARELGVADLVPLTVYRQVPDPSGDEVQGSVQVLWPRFELAQGHFTHVECPDDVAWRIALFDAIIANTDRNDGNWGALGALPYAVMIDHGHCFTKAPNCTSPFFTARQGQQIPDELVENARRFCGNAGESRLKGVLADQYVQETVHRAQHMVDTGLLALP